MFISFLLKAFDKKKGIVVTEDYLIENSKYESIGKIMWEDISSIKIKTIYSGSYLELDIVNLPKNIQKKQLNFLQRTLIPLNSWSYKKSIIINNRTLDCTQKELEELIMHSWNVARSR